MGIPAIALCALIGYFLGCFSTGIYLSGQRHMDIRQYGSKSSGATNMTRVMGPQLGLLTFIGDFLKATLAVLAGYLLAGYHGALVGGLGAVIGHNWPVYYGFKGGKGIACSVAVLAWVAPLEAILGGAAFFAIVLITRYVSLGSLVLLLSSWLLIMLGVNVWPTGIWALALFVMAAWRHRTNIARLIAGTENTFTFSKAAKPGPPAQ